QERPPPRRQALRPQRLRWQRHGHRGGEPRGRGDPRRAHAPDEHRRRWSGRRLDLPALIANDGVMIAHRNRPSPFTPALGAGAFLLLASGCGGPPATPSAPPMAPSALEVLACGEGELVLLRHTAGPDDLTLRWGDQAFTLHRRDGGARYEA